MERFFSEDQFGRVYALLRRERKIHTKQREAIRRYIEGVYWMSRSGAQWRFLPAAYGAWNSVYKRFARWDALGIWERLLAGVAADPDMQAVMIDATVIRAHACAAGAPRQKGIAAQGLGRSRGGFSTKLHVLVDALGNPLRFILTSGAAGDNPQAIPLLAGVQTREVVADRGYDADRTLAYIEQDLGATATIPPRKNRTAPHACDYAAYRERHLVECLIGKLKHFRRVFSRFDKYATRYLAFVYFASTAIWLR
jgi:transposase